MNKQGRNPDFIDKTFYDLLERDRNNNLPNLIGSVKQIRWASAIRNDLYNDYTKMCDSRTDNTVKKIVKANISKMLENIDAHYWIEMRNVKIGNMINRETEIKLMKDRKDAEEQNMYRQMNPNLKN